MALDPVLTASAGKNAEEFCFTVTALKLLCKVERPVSWHRNIRVPPNMLLWPLGVSLQHSRLESA